MVRFGGVPNKHPGMKMQHNGSFPAEEHSASANGSNGTTQADGFESKPNKVQLPLPRDLASDAVLDTVLTAWSILIQRYQRDVFHQFTWGINDASNGRKQCVSTSDLGLLEHNTAGSLRTKISHVKSRDIPFGQHSIFLNDGTEEEVTGPTASQ